MKLRFHLLSICWASFILALNLLPGELFPKHEIELIGIDKVIHFVLYFVLILVTLVGFKKQYFHRGFTYHPISFALIAVVSFSVFNEIIHKVVATRSFEWNDIFANCLGILVGFLCFRMIYGKRLFNA